MLRFRMKFSQNQDWHEGQDVGKRLSENLSSTFDKTDHLSKSISQNLSASEHYSKQATYARDNSVRMDQNYNDQFWSFVEKKTGGSANAISVWESKEPWAEGVRQDMMTEFQSSIEKDAIAKMDTRISSEGGFHGSTSQLQKNYDSSVSNMKQPSRDSFTEQSNAMSAGSSLEGSSQHISENKESLARQGSNNSGAIQNNLTDRNKEMGKAKADMKEEFQENKDETIVWKSMRATGKLFGDVGKPKD
jgi:hypothetical protein